MSRKKGEVFSAEQKTKIVLEPPKEDQTIAQLATKYQITTKSMIHTRFMLFISLIAIFIVYSFVFSFAKIVDIVLDEYIAIGISIILFLVYTILKHKLKNKLLYEFIPNLHYIPIKETIIFFILFQGYDYYNENSLIGMISLWFMYWIFGLCTNLTMHIINLYKNLKAYQKSKLKNL